MFAPARRSYAFFVALGKVAAAIRACNGNDAFFVVLGKVAAAIRSCNGNNAFFVVLGKVAAAIRACGGNGQLHNKGLSLTNRLVAG